MAQHQRARLGRNLRLLLAGNLVSVLGSSVYLIVVVLYLKDETGSAAVLGFYNFVALLPPVVLGPFAGTLVDRWSRRKTLVMSDLLRGALMLLLASFALLPSGIRIAHILVITALGGVLHAFFLPAVHAIIPDIVPQGALKRANSLRAGTAQIGNLAGNAVGGLVYAAVGFVPVLIVIGISFFLSAVQESWIRYAEPAGLRSQQPFRAAIRETVTGVSYIMRRRGLRALLFANSAIFLLSPPLLLVLPFVVEDVFELPTAFVGFYFAIMLAGGIAAYALWACVPLAAHGDRRVLIGSFFLLAAAILTTGLFLDARLLFVTLFLAGASIASVNLVVVTTVQRVVPPLRRGRVFALLESLASLSAPFAYAFGGVLIDLLLQDIALVFYFTTAVVLLVAAVSLRSGGLRRMLVG